jgi:two-component system phosphate regulon sensor histidine kinase PhoR
VEHVPVGRLHRLELRLGDRDLDVRTKRGTEGGAVVLIVDITEIKRLDAVRSDFVANASHELKTPLTVIRAAAETVQDEELPSDLRSRFLHSIEGNTVRLQRLVDDLLDLSRYESGAWRPERLRFAVEDVARAAWMELHEKATGRAVAFEISGSGEALGDEAATYQVFRNLFENALRYVPEGSGRIAVDIEPSGSRLVVAVKDNGSGIPASALPRIFERFYRVDAARSREEGGTGLGLAIVRHLVSSMGGEVDAASIWGAGTTITFTIPAAT